MAIDAIVAPRARDIEERRHLVERVGELAGNWPILAPAEKITVIHRLVKAIIVTMETVAIMLRAEALLALASCRADHLAPPGHSPHRAPHEDDRETITLSVPAMLKRVGMENRHLVEAPEIRPSRNPTAVCCGCSPERIGSAT